jgi:hypothetical protein
MFAKKFRRFTVLAGLIGLTLLTSACGENDGVWGYLPDATQRALGHEPQNIVVDEDNGNDNVSAAAPAAAAKPAAKPTVEVVVPKPGAAAKPTADAPAAAISEERGFW